MPNYTATATITTTANASNMPATSETGTGF